MNELHRLWHSRSLILQKLQNNNRMFKDVSEIKEKKSEEEKKDNKMKALINNKKEYIKKHIKLPPISEILQKEMKTRLKKSISTSNINPQSRNKYIIINNNKKISNKSNNSLIDKEKDKKSQDSSKSKNILNLKSFQSNKVESKIKTLKSLNNNCAKTGNEINYLEGLRQKRLLKNIDKNINMSKDLLNSDNNVFNLKNKIEAIESKYKRNKELLKLKGGYLKNQELGDNMDELLIDSIKGKLSIIENN